MTTRPVYPLDFTNTGHTVARIFATPMRTRLLTFILSFAFFTTVSLAEEVLDGVAAIVNQDVITFSDVRQLVSSREQTLRETFRGDELANKVKEGRLAAINELIDRQLVLQEFDKNKFQIPEFAIDEQINGVIRTQFNGDRAAFIRTLQAQNFTLQRFRKMERDRFIVQQMRSRSVKVNPLVSPGKLEQYYAKNKAEFSTPEQVKLRMIILSKDSENAKSTAEEIRAKVKGGADFGELAAMYSEDSSKENGGDWGWIDRSTLNDSLSKPAFALKAGQVSDIIELGDRWYLLYAEARQEGGAKPFATVRNQVAEKLIQAERQEAQEKWIQSLRSKAYIKVY